MPPAQDTVSHAMSRLCVFFHAGRVRYAIEALGVLEVATPDPKADTLHGHLGLRDLSQLLGGPDEAAPTAALVLDTSPTLAARVTSVEGVFDAAPLEAPRLSRRLIPYLSPVVKGAVVHQGHLVFELDVNAVVRGLPRPDRVFEVRCRPAEGQGLRFSVGGREWGLPLTRVVQVIQRGTSFNRMPFEGALKGALAYRGQLVPVYSLAGDDGQGPLMVLAELAPGELVAFPAERADGVRPARELDPETLIDLERTFS